MAAQLDKMAGYKEKAGEHDELVENGFTHDAWQDLNCELRCLYSALDRCREALSKEVETNLTLQRQLSLKLASVGSCRRVMR